MSVELGSGYVSLTADARQLGKEISRDLEASIGSRGRQVGDQIAADLQAGVSGTGRTTGAEFANEFSSAARSADVDLSAVGAEAKQVGDSAGQDFSQGFAAEAEAGADQASEGFLSSLGSKVKAGALAIGVAAGAALKTGLQDTYAAEAINDRIAASLSLTPTQAATVSASAAKVYRNAYGESLEGVNATIEQAITARLIDPDAAEADIERVTIKLADMAAAFGEDTGAITQAASALVRNGLAANVDEALDLITSAEQAGLNVNEDLYDSFAEYSSLFPQIGVDGAGMVDVINQGLKLGIRNTDLIADGFKEFAIRVQDGSKLSTDALTGLGLSAEDIASEFAKGGDSAKVATDKVLEGLRNIEDPVERNRLGVALFGTQFEDTAGKIAQIDVTPAVNQFDNATRAADRMGATLNDNVSARVEAFKRQALGGIADITARYVIPAFTAVKDVLINDVVPAVQSAWEWFSINLLPTMQATGASLRDSIIPALADAAGWINEHVVPAVQSLWSWVQQSLVPALQSFWDWLVINLTPSLAAFKDNLIVARDNASTMAKAIREDVLPPLQDMWQRFRDDILPLLKRFAEFMLQNVVPALIELKTTYDRHMAPVLTAIIGFIGFVIQSQVALYDALKSIGKAVGEVVSGVKDDIDKTVGFFRDLPGRIDSAVRGAFDGLTDAFKGAINGVISIWNGFEFPALSVLGKEVTPAIRTPNIPYLAAGGVITEPTVAMLGETSRARPEIATPEYLMRDVFATELARTGSGAVFNNTFNGTDLTAQDVTAEMSWQLRSLGVFA